MACLQEMFYYSTCACEIEGERWDDLCPCQACVDLPIAALPRLNVANWYFHPSSIYHVSPCYQMICPPATHGCYLSSKFSSNLILTPQMYYSDEGKRQLYFSNSGLLWGDEAWATLYIVTGRIKFQGKNQTYFLKGYIHVQQTLWAWVIISKHSSV